MYDLTVNKANNVFYKDYKFSLPERAYWSDFYNSENSTPKNNKQKYVNAGLIVLASGALFFSKGVQKKSKNILENLKEYLSRKQDRYLLDEKSSKLTYYDFFIRKINSFIKKSESINNINSIKDMLFMKFMYKTAPTKFIHKGITTFFEKLSRNTVIKSYKHTQKYFDKMYAGFDKLDEYILKHCADETVDYGGKEVSKRELIEKARDNRLTIKTVVESCMDKRTLNYRYNYIKDSTSTLYSKIWNESFKDFWTKDNKFKRKEMWQTFIAAEQVKTNKTDLSYNVSFARDLLSYTDTEKKAYILTYINNLNSIISNKDVEGIKIIERLKWYAKDNSSIIDNKENFFKELEQLEKHKFLINGTEDPDVLKDKDTNISLIRKIFREDKPGDIEEMLDIYRKIAPIELSKSGALNSLQKAVKSFDKSLNLEMAEFFDKLRDLEIGSAPTDILTILFSSAMIVYALEKAKNKEERTSILLKSGIPIAGAIAVTLISATKLVSGGKSLALGFVSGIILNTLGKNFDNYRKIRRNKC